MRIMEEQLAPSVAGHREVYGGRWGAGRWGDGEQCQAGGQWCVLTRLQLHSLSRLITASCSGRWRLWPVFSRLPPHMANPASAWPARTEFRHFRGRLGIADRTPRNRREPAMVKAALGSLGRAPTGRPRIWTGRLHKPLEILKNILNTTHPFKTAKILD